MRWISELKSEQTEQIIFKYFQLLFIQWGFTKSSTFLYTIAPNHIHTWMLQLQSGLAATVHIREAAGIKNALQWKQ